MSRKRSVANVLVKAKKYRRFTRMIGDPETVRRILDLTEELKQTALALAKADEDRVRIHAREIWDENGKPFGRDQEFWYRAEREFREAEDLAIHAAGWERWPQRPSWTAVASAEARMPIFEIHVGSR